MTASQTKLGRGTADAPELHDARDTRHGPARRLTDAQLNDVLTQPGHYSFLSFDTDIRLVPGPGLGFTDRRPGRFIITRDPTYGPAILAAWQDGTTGRLHGRKQHRTSQDALSDLLMRALAGVTSFEAWEVTAAESDAESDT